MKRYQKLLLWTTIVLAILLILTGWLACERIEELKETRNLYEAEKAEKKQYRNKYNQQITTVEFLKGERKKDILKLKTKDSTIIRLQSLIKDYKGKLKQATIIINETESSGSSGSTVVKTDTVVTDSLIYVWPTYETNWSNKWEVGWISADKDSIRRQIKIFNEYEQTTGYLREKWWKPKEPKIKIKNLNPNTVTTDVRTYVIEPDYSRWSIGVTGGYGLDLSTLEPGLYIVGGVQYRIIMAPW